MATIITQGLILEVRPLESGKTAFTLSENIGSKENPHYNVYNCLGTFSEEQNKYIVKDKIVEVVGSLKIRKEQKEDKYFTNIDIFVFNLSFKGSKTEKKD